MCGTHFHITCKFSQNSPSLPKVPEDFRHLPIAFLPGLFLDFATRAAFYLGRDFRNPTAILSFSPPDPQECVTYSTSYAL